MKLWGDSVMTAVPHLHFPGTARLILIPTLCQVYFCPPLVLRCTHSIKVTLLLRLTNSPGYESMYQSNNSSGLFYKTLQLLQGDFAAYFSSYCRCQIIIASVTPTSQLFGEQFTRAPYLSFRKVMQKHYRYSSCIRINKESCVTIKSY